MLGKLVKYDLKYGVKIFIILHAVLLVACIISRFLFLDNIDLQGNTHLTATPLILLSSMLIFLFTSVSIGMGLLLAVRFYKNLYTDEGYLTLTLPATSTQQLWAKIISGAIWYVADVLLCTVALVILATSRNVMEVWNDAAPKFTKAVGIPLDRYTLYLFIFTLFGTVCGIFFIYACISIGQLFPGHRVLCSIIVFFIISTISQVMTIASMFLLDLLPNTRINAPVAEQTVYLFKLLAMSGVLSLIMTIILYIITHHIMKKKTNLL